MSRNEQKTREELIDPNLRLAGWDVLQTKHIIEKNSVKLLYHTSHGIFETYNSFSKIENDLPENFVRCHKSFIVNVNNIVNISLPHSTITFKNDDICYIGPKYKNCFMEVINYDTVSK